MYAFSEKGPCCKYHYAAAKETAANESIQFPRINQVEFNKANQTLKKAFHSCIVK